MSLKHFPGFLAADIDTRVEDANSEASIFLVLIDYLSGLNSEHRAVPLRAAVEQSADDEWLITEKALPIESAKSRSIRFDLPDGATLAQLPEPTDPRIRLRTVAPRRTASIWFAGEATPQRIHDQTNQLQDFIALNGYSAKMHAACQDVSVVRWGPFRAFTRLSIAVSDWRVVRHIRPVSYTYRAPGLHSVRKAKTL